MFKCTWKDCAQMTASCPAIEQHIRTQHLGLGVSSTSSDDDDDHEEEFYWTEVEVNVATSVEPPPEPFLPSSPTFNLSRPPSSAPLVPPVPTMVPIGPSSPLSSVHFLPPARTLHASNNNCSLTLVSSPPTLSHMDMARPPHEDPDYRRHYAPSVLSSSWPRSPSYLASSHRGGKARAAGMTKGSSGRGKRSGESRKCRKVYGMEQKDQWCTQCKWKKACSRFGE